MNQEKVESEDAPVAILDIELILDTIHTGYWTDRATNITSHHVTFWHFGRAIWKTFFQGKIAQLWTPVASLIFNQNVSNFGIVYFKS